ncbi:Spermatogenesis-associated protein 5 ATPase family protein 2 -like protein [Takifugu flavidus]|uniref:Spermatogenesis-associated protein 5 ATPase family protein 2-like protein n=1 Tax=Takifugu flavidus TaxID=433684 RepID=A0A5C6ML75_9TELE|nr:Spermatogenesis-associated protein 5 ATPase family protein 2 -like protein [Takifugu flavidus]
MCGVSPQRSTVPPRRSGWLRNFFRTARNHHNMAAKASVSALPPHQITAVCREAALLALQDDIKAQRVLAGHFEGALSTVKPRIPDSLVQSYVSYQQQRSGGLSFF